MTKRWWLAVALVCALLAGCAHVPTSGPVRRVPAGSGRVDQGVEIAPAPPGQDATRTEAVEGFLHAMAAYQPDYSVARAYLTPEASHSWDPSAGVQIYAEGYPMTVTEQTARLDAPIVGRLDAHGVYSQANGTLQHDFRLVQNDAGQWRISNPPAGLLVSQYLFESAFVQATVYHWAKGRPWLVPDTRYFRRGNQALVEAARSVLKGPTPWLAPSVEPTPAGLELKGVSLTTEGVAELTVERPAEPLSNEQQDRLVTQLAWTYRHFPVVNGVVVRYSDGSTWPATATTVATTSRPEVDPVDMATTRSLYVVTKERLSRVTDDVSEPQFIETATVPADVSAIAVRADSQQAALVTGQGNDLSLVALPQGKAQKVLTRPGLGRPCFSRVGELWVPDGTASVGVYSGGKWQWPTVARAGVVTHLAVSPDAARAALVTRDADGVTHVGLVRIVRSDTTVALENWRPLEVAAGDERLAVLDVGWSAYDTLTVLVRDPKGTSVISVGSDGSRRTGVGPATSGEWDELSVAPGMPPVARAKDGMVSRYFADYRWSSYLEGVDAVAHAR